MGWGGWNESSLGCLPRGGAWSGSSHAHPLGRRAPCQSAHPAPSPSSLLSARHTARGGGASERVGGGAPKPVGVASIGLIVKVTCVCRRGGRGNRAFGCGHVSM